MKKAKQVNIKKALGSQKKIGGALGIVKEGGLRIAKLEGLLKKQMP